MTSFVQKRAASPGLVVIFVDGATPPSNTEAFEELLRRSRAVMQGGRPSPGGSSKPASLKVEPLGGSARATGTLWKVSSTGEVSSTKSRASGAAAGGSAAGGSAAGRTAAFGDGDTFVVKRSRYVAKEAANLRRLHQKLSGHPLASTLPRPLALDEEAQLLAMSFLPSGGDLWGLLFGVRNLQPGRDRSAEALFRHTGAWIASFGALTNEGLGPLEEVQDALERLRLWPSWLERWRKPLLTRLERHTHTQGVRVECHGDFAPRNVMQRPKAFYAQNPAMEEAHPNSSSQSALRHGSPPRRAPPGVSVVDWEMMPSGPRGRAYDAVHFATLARRHPEVTTLRRARFRGLMLAFWDGFASAADSQAQEQDPKEAWEASRLAAQVVVMDRQLKAARHAPVRSALNGRWGFLAWALGRLP